MVLAGKRLWCNILVPTRKRLWCKVLELLDILGQSLPPGNGHLSPWMSISRFNLGFYLYDWLYDSKNSHWTANLVQGNSAQTSRLYSSCCHLIAIRHCYPLSLIHLQNFWFFGNCTWTSDINQHLLKWYPLLIVKLIAFSFPISTQPIC